MPVPINFASGNPVNVSAGIVRPDCTNCGACCRQYIVPVTGRDIWTISRGTGLDADRFTAAEAQDPSRSDGFHLAVDDQLLHLVLKKQGELERGRPCTFLIEESATTSRCGIYKQRPLVCRTYPFIWESVGVVQWDGARLCLEPWSESASKESALSAVMYRAAFEMDLYISVMTGWNDWIALRPTGAPTISTEQFFSVCAGCL